MAVMFGRLVGWCARHRLLTVILALFLAVAAGGYAIGHLSVNTNTSDLISAKLPWRQREAVYDKAFPQTDAIVVVVDGHTPEEASAAADALTGALQKRPDLFPIVSQPQATTFFRQNGLLFRSTAEVRATTSQLVTAEPFLGPLASDPSLRGVMTALSTSLQGVSTGQAKLDQLDKPVTALGRVVADINAGRRADFSWRTLVQGKPASVGDRRAIILVQPKLDFERLQPGSSATGAIRFAAAGLRLDPAHGVTVRLTGETPLEDEEFATLSENAGWIGAAMLGAIVAMIWLATRSFRVVACILVTTFVGLIAAAALGLAAFGKFNVISIAFIPLFVGLGVDFGIQFSVRFRAEQGSHDSVVSALIETGEGMGRSLTIAACAIAVGFLSFIPTDYSGVSQLGFIAGAGLLIALALNLTLLPALIAIARPTKSLREAGLPQLAPVDRFILAHRRRVLIGAAVAAGVGLCLMPLLRFDFNPLHLRSARTQSVSTLLDLMRDPDQATNTIDVLKPSLAAADAQAARLSKLAEVDHSVTLSSFVPDDQPAKLALITDASTLLDPVLNPFDTRPAPSDAETIAALRQTAADLSTAATGNRAPSAAHARSLAAALQTLAAAPASRRKDASNVIITPLNVLLNQLRTALQAQPVTLDSLPPDMKRDWVAADGRARIAVYPKGDSNDNVLLQRFARAVQVVEPTATGAAISIQNSGATIVNAFVVAGALSFVAITALLFLVLRRLKDVAVTMAPLLVTGLLTLGTCVLIGQPLNYANIIALPLLFGIGVAFHIYFVMVWRSGGGQFLESSLARAVFFSALTTATGFGSLWLSSHPGTASMGKLLMISLIWTLVTALVVQPALMGRPPGETPLAG